MTKQERAAASMLLGGLAETLGQRITPQRLAGMLDALDDVSLVYLQMAIEEARQLCEFVPAPAVLRKMAKAARARQPLPALPPMDHDEEVRRVVESWQGKGGEARALLEAMPRGPAGRAVSDTMRAAIEQRYREMQSSRNGGNEQ